MSPDRQDSVDRGNRGNSFLTPEAKEQLAHAGDLQTGGNKSSADVSTSPAPAERIEDLTAEERQASQEALDRVRQSLGGPANSDSSPEPSEEQTSA